MVVGMEEGSCSAARPNLLHLPADSIKPATSEAFSPRTAARLHLFSRLLPRLFWSIAKEPSRPYTRRTPADFNTNWMTTG